MLSGRLSSAPGSQSFLMMPLHRTYPGKFLALAITPHARNCMPSMEIQLTCRLEISWECCLRLPPCRASLTPLGSTDEVGAVEVVWAVDVHLT